MCTKILLQQHQRKILKQHSKAIIEQQSQSNFQNQSLKKLNTFQLSNDQLSSHLQKLLRSNKIVDKRIITQIVNGNKNSNQNLSLDENQTQDRDQVSSPTYIPKQKRQIKVKQKNSTMQANSLMKLSDFQIFEQQLYVLTCLKFLQARNDEFQKNKAVLRQCQETYSQKNFR
ncbi:UNKNOWN [Stylonychia lemnae]|uniref:Uncharacterized protein n=1 Tax=Stylonychia lemnae TaxID=5949 RepID=A0A078B8P9_STYLE|nr:UNKNOWN [Stylonychia lemnae]|eukprot:CDW90870.1 UNKNOWN [Stylonychia lemnae]